LAHFRIPLKPMLGCIAAAPSISGAAPGTGDSGFYGGNMDFNEVGEGSTVYLRVSNPGALLYVGDGHAAQGHGEINGNALETSMDVELRVDVIPNKRIGDPVSKRMTRSSAWGSTARSMTPSKKLPATWQPGLRRITNSRLPKSPRRLEPPLNTG
jgi:acetamidase/formamidase